MTIGLLGVAVLGVGMAVAGVLWGEHRARRKAALDYANRTLAEGATRVTETTTDLLISERGVQVVSHHVTQDGQAYDITSDLPPATVDRLVDAWARVRARRETPTGGVS